MAALGRAAVAPADRVDVTIYIDEFTTFGSDIVAQFLSENRKYRCAMVLSCQHFSQARPEVLDSILGNVGSLIAFRVGEKDAQILSRQFGSVYHPDAFTNLGNFEVAVKMLQDGRQHEPFLGRTLPGNHTVFGRGVSLLRHCRQRYGTCAILWKTKSIDGCGVANSQLQPGARKRCQIANLILSFGITSSAGRTDGSP